MGMLHLEFRFRGNDPKIAASGSAQGLLFSEEPALDVEQSRLHGGSAP
jgi:hypothetical protein